MSLYIKPSKWKVGHFPTERILAIAASGGFSVHRYRYRDDSKNKRAKKLVKEGLLKYLGTDGDFREYVITELGKSKLKDIRNSKP